jgi:uncharacterized protein
VPEAGTRIAAVDLARGIAMLGVALVNVHAFAAVWSSVYGLDLAKTTADVVAETVTAVLFTHRSYPVLAFLFGTGLAWQWSRSADNAPTERAPHRQLRPRLWALLMIGVVHGLLLWPGDVLAAYAVIGLLLVGLFKRSNRTILWVAVAAYGATALLYLLLGTAMMAIGGAPYAVEEPAASFAASTLSAALARHPAEFWERGLVQLMVTDFWAHVLLGMWAARSGALQRLFAAPFAAPVLAAGGAGLFAVGTGLELYAARHGGWDAATVNYYGTGLMTLAVLPASLGGLWFWLTVAALCSRSRYANSRLAALVAASGRAPLSQFIGQSIIFALLFNKSLVGWHGEMGRGGSSLVAIAVCVLLAAFLRAWSTSGHPHGPMEMLWRRLTNRLSPPPS